MIARGDLVAKLGVTRLPLLGTGAVIALTLAEEGGWRERNETMRCTGPADTEHVLRSVGRSYGTAQGSCRGLVVQRT
jgi:hypothetical protein